MIMNLSVVMKEQIRDLWDTQSDIKLILIRYSIE